MILQTPKGTKDILPDQTALWQALEETCRTVSKRYGYREIRTPIFEYTDLFARGIGEATDIVGKEMYTFVDKGDKSLTLRPELTASIARAVLQNNLMEQGATLRLWYYGPLFRRERPQKGRYRQFHQYGAELLGSAYPESDVEVIQLAYDLLRGLGLSQFELKINTLGNEASRLAYRTALLDYLRPRSAELSEESRTRLEKNPLRILDSKDPQDRDVVVDAPVYGGYLDEESKAYFAKVCEQLDALAIPYTVSEHLVRGLDYYSHTVFEFTTGLLGAQDALGGGGRYDGLFEQIGEKKISGVGFASGIERLLLLMESEGVQLATDTTTDVYVVTLDDESRTLGGQIARELRALNRSVVTDLQRRSFKAQMKEANKLGAVTVVIIGESERAAGKVILKDMATGEQSDCPIGEIAARFGA